MAQAPYTPPSVWQWEQKSDNQFANINRPIAGPTHDKTLPVGKHPIQLYSVATPNGVKVTILLEELLALGHEQVEYDAWFTNIFEGEQFGSGFTQINPNSKIPAIVDQSVTPNLPIFESGAIMLYLAEKCGELLPQEQPLRSQCLSWLMWQMGSAPYLGGGFGHFFAYAEEKQAYPINRFTMEVKRQLDVLDKQLADKPYLCGDTYTLADIAVYPWYGALLQGQLYDAAEFLDVASYQHAQRWADNILARPAVQRGRKVNRIWGDESEQLIERHSADDFS